MEEINIRNKIMLDNSVNNAKYVAYKSLEKEITIIRKEHKVIGSIADTNFKIGDEIISVNNIDLEDFNTLKEIINNSNIDDEVEVKIIRNKKEIIIKEKIKEINDEKALGIILITNYEYETDPKIEINFKKSESGSSGGLMMALSIYTALSEEDLLKGRKVAGTGTIDIDGNVGEISGPCKTQFGYHLI